MSESKLEKVSKVQFSDEDFFTSSYTKPRHDCVEVAFKDGVVAVRDSKGDGTQLRFTQSEWEAFKDGVRNDEFD